MAAKSRSLKVGVFVALAFVLATLAVFLIGDNRRQWDRKVTFHAKFDNVVGLKPGAAVRIAGIDVGSVTHVGHGKNPSDPIVYVSIAVARSEAVRVKPDTVAKIVGRGLLGDKMIELSGGDPLANPAPPDSTIASEADPSDLGKAMADIQDSARDAKAALAGVRAASERIADPKFNDDLHGTVKALREVLDGIAHGEGTAHRLIYSKEEAQRIDRILANLDATTANLAQVSADARDITARAKTGPGLAHTLVYDDKTAESASGALAELNGALRGVRTGNGLAHAVIYGDDAGTSQHVMSNLSAMSDDLREIVANMKAGRGTIGALLVDPSVYEDVKSLVGNVERNQVLRALVRYSIKQDDDQRAHADVKDDGAPAPAPAAPAAPAGASR
jgi:phospholipid/cholesterol/gamma-HCH transport system substrate-binding protein